MTGETKLKLICQMLFPEDDVNTVFEDWLSEQELLVCPDQFGLLVDLHTCNTTRGCKFCWKCALEGEVK